MRVRLARMKRPITAATVHLDQKASQRMSRSAVSVQTNALQSASAASVTKFGERRGRADATHQR
jgi:hypothetical protein